MGNTNGEKVAVIVQEWNKAAAEHHPNLTVELMAQIAVNVLTDWHKREP